MYELPWYSKKLAMYLEVYANGVARFPYFDGLHHSCVSQLSQHEVIVKLTRTLYWGVHMYIDTGLTERATYYLNELSELGKIWNESKAVVHMYMHVQELDCHSNE